MRLVECVPNVSTIDPALLRRMTTELEAAGAVVLHVDPGLDAHRTVITFVVPPDTLEQAGLALFQCAYEGIDLRKHVGTHPRIGAVDVFPVIPLVGVTREEGIDLARTLAASVADAYDIPIYLYEQAASAEHRRHLSQLRRGGYQGLSQRLLRPEWRPDFGPTTFQVRWGASVIGARSFLVAYNVNLATTDVAVSKAIAARIRASARDVSPARLPGVRALGWPLPEFARTQVSMNLVDLTVTSMKRAFDVIRDQAADLGAAVEGSELVGLAPLNALLDGFASVEAATDYLGLSSLRPFDPETKVLEYNLDRRGVPRPPEGFALEQRRSVDDAPSLE